MRDYGRIRPQFWTEKIGRQLRGKPLAQVVLVYLNTCPNSNMIGLYYLPLPIIAHETGVAQEQVAMALNFLRQLDVAFYDSEHELVYLPAMASEQIGEALPKTNVNMIKGVVHALEKHEGHPFWEDFVARYAGAYHLQHLVSDTSKLPRRGFEGPSKGLRSVPVVPSEGLGTGELFTTRPLRDQDQDQDTEQEQEIASGARAPARSNEEARLWPPHEWLRKYGLAWRDHYQQVAYGQGGDSKACAALGEQFDQMSEEERLAAQEKAPEMFAEYLRCADKRDVERRHPFAFFVQAFGGLRAPKLQVAPVESFAERDRRLAAERAEKDREKSDRERLALEEKLRRDRNFTPPTAAEQEDIHEIVRGLANGKAVAQ